MAQKGQKQRTNGAVGKTHGNQTPPHTIAQQRTFGVWLKRFAEPNPRWWRDEVARLANCQSIEQKQLKVDLPGRVFKCKYGKSLNKSANKKKKTNCLPGDQTVGGQSPVRMTSSAERKPPDRRTTSSANAIFAVLLLRLRPWTNGISN